MWVSVSFKMRSLNRIFVLQASQTLQKKYRFWNRSGPHIWSSSRDLITIAECSKIDVFTDKFEHVASSFFGFGWPDGILTQKNRKTCSKTWSTNDLAKLTGNRNLKVQDTCGYFLSILVRQILIKKYNFLSLNHLELVNSSKRVRKYNVGLLEQVWVWSWNYSSMKAAAQNRPIKNHDFLSFE